MRCQCSIVKLLIEYGNFFHKVVEKLKKKKRLLPLNTSVRQTPQLSNGKKRRAAGGGSYHGSSVIGCCDCPEPLLSRCVPARAKQSNSGPSNHWSLTNHSPYLQFDFLSIQLDGSDFEVNSWKVTDSLRYSSTIRTQRCTTTQPDQSHQTINALQLQVSVCLSDDIIASWQVIKLATGFTGLSSQWSHDPRELTVP